jgi:sulfite exporter TauE/SafE
METGARLLAAFVTGLLSSGHCFAMCGGIAGALASRGEARPSGSWTLAARAAAQNAGRLLTYALLGALAGGLAGAAGASLAPAGATGSSIAEAGRIAKLLAALGFAVLALHLTGRTAILAPLERLGGRLFLRLGPLRRALAGRSSTAAAVATGAIWGFLPCGLVYSTLLLASTGGDALQGALTMLAFGAGTAPSLIAAGIASASFARLARGTTLRRLAAAGCLVAAVLLGSAAFGKRAGAGTASAPACHVAPAD